MITKLRYKEVQGKVIEEGIMTVKHNFEDINELIRYIRKNWSDLENAVEIKEIEFDPDIDGDFILTIGELKEE